MHSSEPNKIHQGLNEKQVRALNNIWVGLRKNAKPRFDRYADGDRDRDGFDPLARYLWNIALGEALMTTLNGSEVMLKNAIHNAMVDDTRDDWWFNVPGKLENGEEDLLARAWRDTENKKKRKKDHTQPNANDLIAELSFKFWTGLLSHEYEDWVWTTLLKRRLPNLDEDLRDRNTFKVEFNRIRDLRNRIAHHEPIFHMKDLTLIHTSARRLIGQINAIYSKMMFVLDRFEDVYAAGPEHYRAMLLMQAGHTPAFAFEVRPQGSGHGLFDVDLETCASVFDCQGLADWLSQLANRDPSRSVQVNHWRQWADEQKP